MLGRVKTFGDVLDQHRGVGPGFDVLRILLAATIFYGHAKWTSGHAHLAPVVGHVADMKHLTEGGWEGWKRPLMVSLVPAFFAVSGFLVTGSALRQRVTRTFLAFRALRIFPALVVEVTLSAVILGFFFTSLTPAAYFTDPQFFRYMGNMVGWITFELPGVFTHNPVPNVVNANLWTLPSEFDCYLISALLMASTLLYRRTLLTVVFAVLTAAFAYLNVTGDFSVTSSTMAPVAVTYYFFMGVLFYHWREKIPLHWALILGAGAVGYWLQRGHHAVYIAPIFVTYVALAFGMLPIPKLPLISKGDYSYGIYLYGFPITQGCLAAIPALRGNGWATLAVAGLATVAFAAFSWHVIEKPTLALKKKLPAKFFPSSRAVMGETPQERAVQAA